MSVWDDSWGVVQRRQQSGSYSEAEIPRLVATTKDDRQGACDALPVWPPDPLTEGDGR